MLLDGLKSKYEGFTLPTHDNFVDAQHAYRPTYVKQATILPSQVNFVVQGHKIPGFGHPDTAALYVLGTLLSNTFLHKEIREKGGAYGSGCSVSPMKGVMNMWSYRDPNILETLDTYARIHLDDVQDVDLQEAKFSIFQKLDRPKDPQSKGIEEIFYGILINSSSQASHPSCRNKSEPASSIPTSPKSRGSLMSTGFHH